MRAITFYIVCHTIHFDVIILHKNYLICIYITFSLFWYKKITYLLQKLKIIFLEEKKSPKIIIIIQQQLTCAINFVDT